MSHKLALHVQIVPIHKLYSEFLDIRNKNSHNQSNEIGSGEVV